MSRIATKHTTPNKSNTPTRAMPTYALTPSGDPISAQAAASDDDRRFECPYCSHEMYLAGGQHTQFRKHFRHHRNESCYDYDQEGETRAHLEAKADVELQLLERDLIDAVDVEQRLGSGQPDVAFELDGDTIGIEIQVSSIGATEIADRTRQRTADGLYTLWIFHDDTFATEQTSSSGNDYVAFKSGEMGYLNLVDVDESVWVHYFDPESGAIATARRIELFDDRNGGWPEQTIRADEFETFTTRDGLKLATISRAVPDETGDEQQRRLF